MDKKSGYEQNILIKDVPKYNQDTVEEIINNAEQFNELDEEESTKKQRIYTVVTKIEIVLANIKINDLMDQEEKDLIIAKLNGIEETLETLNNTELLNIINEFDTTFASFTKTIDSEQEENKMDSLEKLLNLELKQDLINKINLLLARRPDWTDDLKEVLEKLELTNLTNDYLNEQHKMIDELLNDDKKEDRDYYEEFKSLLLYLKVNYEEGQINIKPEMKEYFEKLINDELKFSIDESKLSNEEWSKKIEYINEQCKLCI
jgi:hypothetical protein